MLLICYGYPNYNAQGAFMIIFFNCSDLYNCLRSLYAVAITTEKEKEKKFLIASSLFVVLTYFHPRNFKFMPKHQQYGPCFQAIFLFLITIL